MDWKNENSTKDHSCTREIVYAAIDDSKATGGQPVELAYSEAAAALLFEEAEAVHDRIERYSGEDLDGNRWVVTLVGGAE